MNFTLEEWKFIQNVINENAKLASKHLAEMCAEDKEIERKWDYFMDTGDLLPSLAHAEDELERMSRYGAAKTILRIARGISKKLSCETI